MRELSAFPINRRQFCGYERSPLVLNDGTSLSFIDFAHTGSIVIDKKTVIEGKESTKELAWLVFNSAFPAWLEDKPGVLLWLEEPQAMRDLKGWVVHCRVAITEDLRFTDETQFADPVPQKAKLPMLTLDEMLVRK